MNPGAHVSWETLTVATAFVMSMLAYALFVGADFGGGIWDLLAGSTKRGEKPRATIDESVTPVWEGNQTWTIFGIVFLWTGFPRAFAAVMTALFVPLALSLLGLLLRGIGFSFRHEAERLRVKQLTGVLFAASSFMTPFFLGACVGAVATGRVRLDPPGNVWSAWTNPTAIMTGVLFVATSAYISAIYLVGDSHHRGEDDMVKYFSRRVLVSGAVTGLLAAGNLYLLSLNAKYVFHRLWGPALPLVIVSVAGGTAAFVIVLFRRVWLLRICGALAVIGVVGAYAIAQYPYIFPTSLTLQRASAPRTSLLAEIAVLGMLLVLVVPAFVYLYALQQRQRLKVTSESGWLEKAVAQENAAAAAQRGELPPPKHRLVTAVVIGAAVTGIVRERISRARRSV